MFRSLRQSRDDIFYSEFKCFFRWLLYFYLTIVFCGVLNNSVLKKDDVGRTIDIDI